MIDLGFVAAFIGGAFALLSPCSALLLPSFFAYAFAGPGRLLGRTGLLYVGLLVTLVPLGVASSAVNWVLYGHRDTVITIGGVLVIALGVAQILGVGFAFRPAQKAAGRIRADTALSTIALGAVYGLAGFCAGPILGGILTVAAVGGNPAYGGILLALYALGMVVPLFVLALLWDRFDLGGKKWLRGRSFTVGRLRLHTTSLISGLFFIAIGIVFLVFDGTSALPGVLDVDQEFAVEQWIRSIGSVIPDVVVPVALLVTLVIAYRLRTRKSSKDSDPDS